MKKPRLLWRSFASYALVVGVLAGMLLAMLRAAMLDEAVARERDVLLAIARARAAFAPETAVAHEGAPDVLFAVFDEAGRSRSASDDRSASVPPEVQAARTADYGWSVRPAKAGPDQMLHVAVALPDGTGFVRASRSTADIRARALDRWGARARLVALAAAAATALGFAFAWHFSHPIEVLRRGAERFGRGELKRRISTPPGREHAELADALNRMAAQLDARIDELEHERNARTAIFESMDEGVIAVDSRERVLSVNRAARRLLGIGGRGGAGKLVQEVCRNVELQRQLSRALAGDFSSADEGAPIRSGGETTMQCRCAPLRDGDGNDIGVVAILTDVTRVQRLENLRREFVANVSHELRTPITSIKGFTETLLDGGMDDPVEARRFLEIVARQADRLSGVIEDLLSLSRLDRGDGIEKKECSLARLLENAGEACRPMAQRQSVHVTIDCAEDIVLLANPVLVEQAATNLIDNAIKYGGAGKKVRVAAERADGMAHVRVADEGPGIEREHRERIFERFYRIDKARSRDVGGTGLGLSIVKNVAQAHGGAVSVSSTAGAGSVFTLSLPLAGTDAPSRAVSAAISSEGNR